MKSVTWMLSLLACIGLAVYLYWFLANVSSMAAAHMEIQYGPPCLVCAIGILATAAGFALYLTKTVKSKAVLAVPLLILAVGIYTFAVAWHTPCCVGA